MSRSERASIRFGTDGWRGLIARDFTFANVARVAQALADFLKDPRRRKLELYGQWRAPYRDVGHGVVIGYDTRFLSEEFAAQVARVLSGNGISVQLAHHFTPTPALSYAVEQRQAACGVMITSSHNPPAYNGFKLKAEFGGSAPPAYTQAIERRLARPHRLLETTDPIQREDFTSPYLDRLKAMVDLRLIAEGKLRVVVDAMHGSGAKCLARILQPLGVSFVEVRAKPDPLFGGYNPEPTPQNLIPLKAVVRAQQLKKNELLIGVVTDGDADRIAGIDDQGEMLTTHLCYTLILRHLVAKGFQGKVVKSFALTDLVDKVARHHRLEVRQVPIGFKYVAERMLTEDVMIGGEESGGIAVKGHILERDGLYMALLLLEIVAKAGKPPSQIVQDLMREFGQHHYERRDFHVESRLEVVRRLKSAPPGELGGQRVQALEDVDGIKLRFSQGWLMFRASGTEPLLRVYCEMDSPQAVSQMLEAAAAYVQSVD